MKKQWLSMILALCMVLCLAPTTAHAAESKKGTLKVITKVIGLPDGVSAAGKTFTFKVGMKLPGGISYQSTPLVITIGADGRTGEGSMEVTSEYQYLVVETAHDDIADYRWDYVTYPGGGYNESKLVWVYENAVSEPIYVNNGFEELANSEINSLPLTVAGYALDADVSAVTVAKMETGVTIQSFKIKQYNAAGSWDDLTSGTFQADTKYAIEIFLGKVAGCNYTGLTEDKVTVNGKEVSVFENPSTGDMRVFHELEVLKVVKTVERIEITKQPTKTEYMAGDKFDPTGMVVTAVYEDGTSEPITNYIIFRGDIDAAEYPDVQRSVEIETNGAGTYQGTLTITGPAVQVQNFVGRGFYVREVQGNNQCWTYSNKEYYVAFDIDNTTREPMLTFYLNNEEVSEMTFANIYTENLTTIEIPFTKTVKLGGNTAPGETDFTIAVCDVNAHDLSYYTDVKYTAAVTTTGAGDYDGKLIISGPAGKVSEFVSEGFYVREVNDGLPKWTYSDAVWYVSSEGEIFPAKMEKTDNGEFYDVINNADAVGKMTFENIYTRNTSYTTPDEKPIASPKTFDAGVARYGVSALLSLTGTALVIKRKNG